MALCAIYPGHTKKTKTHVGFQTFPHHSGFAPRVAFPSIALESTHGGFTQKFDDYWSSVWPIFRLTSTTERPIHQYFLAQQIETRPQSRIEIARRTAPLSLKQRSSLSEGDCHERLQVIR
jgi:hypothetical protein